jgi:phosphoribosylformimino-5-aminoimidazole carboxamide ribonucleotide (ProFAR) isomerase
MLHWQIGVRIKEDVLFNQRAEYGKQVVKNLSEKLTEKYGRGWSDRQLLHCIRAAYTFSEEQIVYALRTQIDMNT